MIIYIIIAIVAALLILVLVLAILYKCCRNKPGWFISLQRERGQWAVYYTSPQSFIITFSDHMKEMKSFLKRTEISFQKGHKSSSFFSDK